MKAESLRIGNYTDIDGLVYKIEHSDISLIFINEDHNYKPIPLTEEWLLKFGFDKEEMTDGYSFIHNTPKTVIDFMYCKINKGFQFNNDDIYIKHVHQLQNLYFALTGKELTLKQ